MISSKSILAIKARLGSKRLKNKYCYLGNHFFMVFHKKKSKYIDKIIISTESKRILNYIKKGYSSNLLKVKNYQKINFQKNFRCLKKTKI